jgi:site-specific recombinase XerD
MTDQILTCFQAKNDFVAYLKSKSKSASTVLGYGKDVDQLVVFLKGKSVLNISEIKEEDLTKFFENLKQKDYTAKSISRKINSVKTFYRYLETNHIIQDNPSLLIEYPKYENKPPHIMTPLEYRALRDAAKDDLRIYAIIELFLQTGIRISEVANLRLEDVKDETLLIRSLEGRPAREIPLNKPAKAALTAYLNIRGTTIQVNHVFITKTGRQLLVRNIRNSIDRYFKIAGITQAKVNDLRHTWIAHHLQNGASLLMVSKIAGHKRLSTTERYLDLIKNTKEEKTKLEEL